MTNKILLSLVAVVTFAVAGIIHVDFTTMKSGLSDVSLGNVEALAENE